MNENHFRTALQRNEFLHSAELVLGRDHTAAEADAFVRDAAGGAGLRVVSVTDLPGGNPALPPEALVAEIAGHGLTPIAHLTGKDGNRALIEGRLHMLARLGVENVLALTGDAQREGFGGAGKGVHDLDSVLILRLIGALQTGLAYRNGARRAVTSPFDFFAGAVVNPYKVREADLMMQLYKLELKVAAGARFIITQLGFNLRKLYELKQYMVREGMGHVPVLANIHVPTAAAARRMQSGELAGCVIADDLVRRLERENKVERVERAAVLLAAVRDLGFAGAHLGGFGLRYADFMAIIERAAAIGTGWRARMDELVIPYPGEFYLFPQGGDGLSDGNGEYRLERRLPRVSLKLRVSRLAHHHIVGREALIARLFAARLEPAAARGGEWRSGPLATLLKPSSAYRRTVLGCVDCGDCIQDHLSYAGCPVSRCHKELRNGPCGGSRPDGSCEAHPSRPCLWNLAYRNTLAAAEDPRRFATTLVPPRDWTLNGTNALLNRYAEIDNLPRRVLARVSVEPQVEPEEATHAGHW